MPPLTTESALRDAAANADRALKRALVLGALVLLVVFFLPWVVKGGKLTFTWQLIRGGSLGRILFLVWIPIAGANLLALALFPFREGLLQAALAVIIGLVPLVALCTMPITFGQPPADVPDTIGYGLLAAMPLLTFGLQHRAAHRRSRAARVALVLGTALVLTSFLVPRQLQEGTVVPLVWLYGRASESAGWAGAAVYLVLPIPFSVAALAGLLPSARLDKPLRVLAAYFLRFIPGMFLLIAFPALTADRADVYRPYVLFVSAVLTAYLGCVVAGASALLARVYARREAAAIPAQRRHAARS